MRPDPETDPAAGNPGMPPKSMRWNPEHAFGRRQTERSRSRTHNTTCPRSLISTSAWKRPALVGWLFRRPRPPALAHQEASRAAR